MECKHASCKDPLCQKVEHRKSSPDAFIFPNADGGFMDADNYGGLNGPEYHSDPHSMKTRAVG